jgi:hypothetical protein
MIPHKRYKQGKQEICCIEDLRCMRTSGFFEFYCLSEICNHVPINFGDNGVISIKISAKILLNFVF